MNDPAVSIDLRRAAPGTPITSQPETVRTRDGAARPRDSQSPGMSQIYAEYHQRITAGEQIDPKAFCARYPSHQHSIQMMMEAVDFLINDPEAQKLIDLPALEAGDLVDGYRIVRPLGRGGRSDVYLAADDETKVGVVVKISPPSGAESQMLALLRHENVTPILRARPLDPVTSIVAMPCMGTSTLADLLDVCQSPDKPGPEEWLAEAVARNRLPDDPPTVVSADPATLRRPYDLAVLHLAREIAEGLAYLHAKSVQHRDLKPSNVVLSAEGRPVIVDFDLAVDSRRERNALGGTPRYMAPEQVRAAFSGGSWSSVDHRADLYSFGVIIYELLAQQHPFEIADGLRGKPSADVVESLLAKQAAGRVALRAVLPNINPEFAALIGRCLEVEPAKRPQSARELADALGRLCRHDPNRAKRRQRWQRVLVAATCVVALGLTAETYHVATRPPFAQRMITKAEKHIRASEYAAAVDDLDQVLKQGVVNPEANFLRGLARLRMGEHKLAIQDLEQARDQGYDPEGATSAELAYCEVLSKSLSRALNYGIEAEQRGFRSAALFNNRAHCRLYTPNPRERDLDLAWSDLENAFDLNPNCVQVFYNRVQVLLQQHQEKKDPSLHIRAVAEVREADRRGLYSRMLCSLGAITLLSIKPSPTDEDLAFAVHLLRKAVELGYDLSELSLVKSTRQLDSRPDFQEVRATAKGAQDSVVRTDLVDPLEDMYR